MKRVSKLLLLVLGFSAGLLAGAFIRLGFEIINGRPVSIGGEALLLPLVQRNFSKAYERGYRKGYGEGLEDGTVEIHRHIDVYHFPEKFQIK